MPSDRNEGADSDASLTERAGEDKLDAYISECDAKSVQAHKDGDPTGCRLWVDRMYAAIRSRSPQHQARRTADLERRMNEDYFGYMGELSRIEWERGQ